MPSPNVVVPLVLDIETPPPAEPAPAEAMTVMSSKTLPVPRLTRVASRPFAPFVVIEIVPADAKFVVNGLPEGALSRTPVDPVA